MPLWWRRLEPHFLELIAYRLFDGHGWIQGDAMTGVFFDCTIRSDRSSSNRRSRARRTSYESVDLNRAWQSLDVRHDLITKGIQPFVAAEKIRSNSLKEMKLWQLQPSQLAHLYHHSQGRQLPKRPVWRKIAGTVATQEE